ncbi:MAG TPA: hypothetical protein DHV28_01760 [Ignavibacteriales bacterium]|nr:hypothetical protein [Ignavibacteriales bacterium]
MKTRLFHKTLILIPILLLAYGKILYCQSDFIVNKSHLDYLYKEIVVDGKEMAIIHIYSNAPDYKYVGDDDEGYACVDDAARAAIFYLEYFKAYNDSSSLYRYYNLVEFLLYMQAENGFFYNFIWEDNSINKTFKTSVAEANWWSWRALWALTEGYDLLITSENDRSTRVKKSISQIIENIKKNIPKEKNEITIEGIKLPDWLPFQFASDQAALLTIILSNYYKVSGDKEILDYLNSLVKGIMMMQINDLKCEYNGAFLSWQNEWHGWGNSQAYALLKAYQVLKNEKLKTAALFELNNFYQRLFEIEFLSSFSVRKTDCNFEIINSNKFSQIAYVIRSMVYALLEAYKITSDTSYAIQAGQIAKWFTGKNPAGEVMYNPHSGIIYDGIENENLINKNSGAESTIEGLLTLLKISQNRIALFSFESE